MLQIKRYFSLILFGKNYSNINFNKGDIYNETENYSQAINCYNIAIKLAPNNKILYYSKAEVFFKLTKNEMACDAIDIALELDPNNTSFLNLKGIYI